MIEKRTVIDKLEILPSGHVQVRFLKQIVEDGKVIAQEYHRTSIAPGVDADQQMAAVNLHLKAMGCADCSDYKMLKEHVAVAHTAEVIAAYKTNQEEKKE